MADSAQKRKEPEAEGENNQDGGESAVPAGGASGALVVKKQKVNNEITLASTKEGSKALTTTVQRTSSLMAPIMLLQGHKAEVFTMKFSPSGKNLASGSFDKSILLWRVHGECENYTVLRGHNSAVLELHWSVGEDFIFSASADKTMQVWDPVVGERLKKCKGHTSFVNSCNPVRRGPQKVVTGSDDCTIKLWDIRMKGCQDTLQAGYPVTSVVFSEQGDQIFSGGIDNDIKVWDIRKNQVVMTLEGHTDSITGMRLSPDGNFLLSNAMDQTVRIWDIRPYCPTPRNTKIFPGAMHNFEKTLLKCAWSADGTKVSAGSADRFVYVWDVATRRILYKLPGHRGTVNETDFHPTEPIIGSASSDFSIYLGEIKA
jgi:Prp8 binding protein